MPLFSGKAHSIPKSIPSFACRFDVAQGDSPIAKDLIPSLSPSPNLYSLMVSPPVINDSFTERKYHVSRFEKCICPDLSTKIFWDLTLFEEIVRIRIVRIIQLLAPAANLLLLDKIEGQTIKFIILFYTAYMSAILQNNYFC